jgi:hypothetical protein
MITLNTGFTGYLQPNISKFKAKKKGLELENSIVFDSEQGQNKKRNWDERKQEHEENEKNNPAVAHIDILA